MHMSMSAPIQTNTYTYLMPTHKKCVYSYIHKCIFFTQVYRCIYLLCRSRTDAGAEPATHQLGNIGVDLKRAQLYENYNQTDTLWLREKLQHCPM